MGWVKNLQEGLYRMRIVPKNGPEDSVSFTNKKDSATSRINDAIESGKRIDLSDLLNVNSLKVTRDKKYEIFEEMVADGRIGAAIEMYANDTVQYNSEGKVIWVESDNSDVANYANKLLEDLNIAENLWSYAYCMWLYGDVYLELFENTSTSGKKPTLLLEPIRQNSSVRTQYDIEGAKLERYIEKVPNAAEVYDLQYKGKTSGFIRSRNLLENTLNNNTYTYKGTVTDINILNPTKFVHICLSPNINRFPEKFNLIKDDVVKTPDKNGLIDGSDTEGNGNSSLSFTVKTGQSILENVYGAYKTLKLKEESVLLERVTKSSITRVIQVELGDMPESQKRKKLQEIKNQIEQQLNMNKDAGTISSRPGAQPIENIIYTTTKNGKGTISTVNIGGDVDIGDLSDVDQSENKVYGALLIPKALLGADMEGTGLSNGGSLTEMNTTYARRIKRGQVAICSAIKTLINIFALSEGLGASHVNNFEVKLTPIITVEDNRRDELMRNKIQNVNDIMELVSKIGAINDTTKLDMLLNWLSNYLNQQDIVDIINKRIQELDEKGLTVDNYDEEDNENNNEDTDSGSDFNASSITSSPSATSASIPKENTKSTPDLKTSEDVNLADIEGQDLL